MNVFLNDPRVQVVAVCDVDRARAQHAAKTFSLRYYPKDRSLGLAVKQQGFCAAGAKLDLGYFCTSRP